MIIDLSSEYRSLDFSDKAKVELDLGCGNGSYVCQLAEAFPKHHFIAVDVMRGRLKSLESKCKHRGIENISIIRANAWSLIDYHLADNALDRLHILCPDPWPKARHRANRLLFSEFIGRLASKIKAGGCLHLSTDDLPYYEQMLKEVEAVPLFKKTPALMDDIKHYKTDFEMGFNEQGIEVNHMTWMVDK